MISHMHDIRPKADWYRLCNIIIVKAIVTLTKAWQNTNPRWELVQILIPTSRNPHIQNNNKEQIYTLGSGHSCVSLEKLMAIDMLDIN